MIEHALTQHGGSRLRARAVEAGNERNCPSPKRHCCALHTLRVLREFVFRTMQAQPNSPAVVQLPVVLPTLTGVDPSWSKRPYALRTVDVKKQPLAGELSVCGGEP